MRDIPDGQVCNVVAEAASVRTLADLAQVLRNLRRRHARGRGDSELTPR